MFFVIFVPFLLVISDIFQDGGQTVNLEAKDNKDILWRSFTYLHSKPIRMKIGAAEVEK